MREMEKNGIAVSEMEKQWLYITSTFRNLYGTSIANGAALYSIYLTEQKGLAIG